MAVSHRDTAVTIETEHGLSNYEWDSSGWDVECFLPRDNEPLSDCALKYTSTIWHQPPGRVARYMSRI